VRSVVEFEHYADEGTFFVVYPFRFRFLHRFDGLRVVECAYDITDVEPKVSYGLVPEFEIVQHGQYLQGR
jgi:hypothetical protein